MWVQSVSVRMNVRVVLVRVVLLRVVSASMVVIQSVSVQVNAQVNVQDVSASGVSVRC